MQALWGDVDNVKSFILKLNIKGVQEFRCLSN